MQRQRTNSLPSGRSDHECNNPDLRFDQILTHLSFLRVNIDSIVLPQANELIERLYNEGSLYGLNLEYQFPCLESISKSLKAAVRIPAKSFTMTEIQFRHKRVVLLRMNQDIIPFWNRKHFLLRLHVQLNTRGKFSTRLLAECSIPLVELLIPPFCICRDFNFRPARGMTFEGSALIRLDLGSRDRKLMETLKELRDPLLESTYVVHGVSTENVSESQHKDSSSPTSENRPPSKIASPRTLSVEKIRIPSIRYPSIYHDPSKITALPEVTMLKPGSSPSVLVVSRHICLATLSICESGFSFPETDFVSKAMDSEHSSEVLEDYSKKPRQLVNSSLLLELFTGVYMVLYDGAPDLALYAIDAMYQRAHYEMLACGEGTIVCSSCVLQEKRRKGLVTTASLRMRKMPEDIPVQPEMKEKEHFMLEEGMDNLKKKVSALGSHHKMQWFRKGSIDVDEVELQTIREEKADKARDYHHRGIANSSTKFMFSLVS